MCRCTLLLLLLLFYFQKGKLSNFKLKKKCLFNSILIYALIKKGIDYDIQTKERMMFFLVYKQHLVHPRELHTFED